MDRSDGRKGPQATRCAASRQGVQALELRVGPRACSVPSVLTLVKIAATTGIEFAFDVVPAWREPTLVRNTFKDTQAHVYAGGSILVASR
jgi:hypothetical protein